MGLARSLILTLALPVAFAAVYAEDPPTQTPEPAPEAAAAAAESVEAEDPEAWRTARPAGYDGWRQVKRDDWDLRLVNALANFRDGVPDTAWSPEETRQIEEALERAIRLGVPPDLVLTFAQRSILWRIPAEETRGILRALAYGIRSDGKCAGIHDLLDETFHSNYRGKDLILALANEIKKRRQFEEGLIPQEDRRKRERKESQELARREAERKAAEERGKKPEEKKEEAHRHQ